MKIVPTATGVVISQTAQVYQPHLIVQPSVQVLLVYFLRNILTVVKERYHLVFQMLHLTVSQ